MVKFAKPFELQYSSSFIELKADYTRADRKGSNFLLRASLANYKRRIQVSDAMSRYPKPLKCD